jgi:HK97 family phage major capsid protein
MKLMDMKKELRACLERKQQALDAPKAAGRESMSSAERADYQAAFTLEGELQTKISEIESQNTLRVGTRGFFDAVERPWDQPVAGPQGCSVLPFRLAETRKPEYARALHAFLSTGGKAHTEELMAGADGSGGYHVPGSELFTMQRLANGSIPRMGAATYESGSGAAGEYAISIPTVDQIVPLALPDLGVFNASLVIPTATSIKIPQQAAFGTSALKAESTGTIATFGGADPTLGQVELDAYTVGALRLASWELLQDAKIFQEFIVSDLLNSQRILEGSLLASGTGTAQPLGVFGNTGTGTGAAYELTGASTDGQLLLNSLFDVTATLKGTYQAGACWIMSRATGLAIRKAQMQTNAFYQVATTDPDGTERILGKPVFYDVNAPALPTATTAGVVPILYGDFKQGYIVGVRGGAGINVKILDQPWAANGQLGILAYRRLDGRVRRSEAIQAITVSHS